MCDLICGGHIGFYSFTTVARLVSYENRKCGPENWQSHIATKIIILLLCASNLKISNFLIFCQIFMIFLPKCRALYVFLEKGHGTREKGHGAVEKGHGATPC